jgi:hypothetical protein
MTSEDQTDRIQQLEKRIEELENKQQLSKFSRRGLLGAIAGVAGLGAMSGSGAAAAGQVGTANNRVDVIADSVTEAGGDEVIADGDGIDRDIYIIPKGASDPSAATNDDIILEKR